MANAISTAGMTVKWAVETTAGTRPSSGYVELIGVKALPAFGDEKNTLQTTPLKATKNHTYIEGLADSGGALALTVNDYDGFRTSYSAMMTAYTGRGAGCNMWVEYCYPGSGMDSFYYPCEPLELGFGGAEVDSVLENSVSLLPVGDYLFATAST